MYIYCTVYLSPTHPFVHNLSSCIAGHYACLYTSQLYCTTGMLSYLQGIRTCAALDMSLVLYRINVAT